MVCTHSVLGQSRTISFPAKDIQKIAQKYTGALVNWPLVIELAKHNAASNTFSLTPKNQLQLQNFGNVYKQVKKQQRRLQSLIGSGATIFAPKELKTATASIIEFESSIRKGSLEKATASAEQLPQQIDQLEETLLENRMISVQAQITHKEGDVDKRPGLLGSWEEAFINDLLKETDGLRTFSESFANLSFTDGSSVLIEPNTEAVIRKSRVDKLDESSDTEITLENGSLLAKLSASGKEKSKYTLRAGPAVSILKSQDFYAEAQGSQTAKLANYDGEAMIKANNVTITIQKNEGTVVEEGKDPLPPVQLLPAPSVLWETADTVIYKKNILFPFSKVKNAVSYYVQYAPSPNFDDQIKNITTSELSVLLQNLPVDVTYARVQAIDKLGLKGAPSQTVRIIRNIDNKPPPLFINNTRNNILFTLQNELRLTGITEPDAALLVDEKPVSVSNNGQFVIKKTNIDTDQTFSISAIDASDNKTNEQLRVIKLTQKVLYNLQFQGAEGDSVLTATDPVITVSGMAYPGLEVYLNLNGIRKNVKTDSQGRWGITFPAQKGRLTISFKDAYNGQSYLTKSYTIGVKS